MSLIERLSPAEISLATKGAEADVKTMMKHTFFDLLLKKVLEIQIVERASRSNKRIHSYAYIIVGSNFHQHSARLHEELFLHPYRKNARSKILIRHLVKIAREGVISESAYKLYMSKNSDQLTSWFNNGWFSRLIRSVRYTEAGLRGRETLNAELKVLVAELNHLKETDPAALATRLVMLHGTVFVLPNFNVQEFMSMDAEFSAAYTAATQKGGFGCSTMWDYYGHSDSSFDSGYDSGTSSGCGTSGCSGGSGCSGCGGCGGCGGCS